MAHDGHEQIGPTAHYTAYAWHKLGLPYAQYFVTPTGAALYWGFRLTGEWAMDLSPRVPNMLEYLGYRHLMIESALKRIEPDAVVEIGAGLSRRGTTWAADHGIRYVEIDLPHMTRAKRERLEAAPPRVRERVADRLELVSEDIFDDDFADRLAGLLAESRRPVVITEGVISYFDMSDRKRLLESIAEGLQRSGGGHYLTDFSTHQREREVGMASRILRGAIQAATGGRGARPPFDDQRHAADVFQGAGFDDLVALAAEGFDDLTPELRRLHSPSVIGQAEVHPR